MNKKEAKVSLTHEGGGGIQGREYHIGRSEWNVGQKVKEKEN